MRLPHLLASACCALLLAGCGGDEGDPKQESDPAGVTFGDAIADAQSVEAGDFPNPRGKTLQQLASALPSINVGLATSVFTPGANRMAFGLIDQEQTFIYGKSAVYLARRPGGSPLGPFPAPADPLVVEPAYRSRGAASPADEIAAIYNAQIKVPAPGKWFVLAMVKSQGKTFGGASQITVTESDPIPAGGERAPGIQTDTLTSAGGDIKAIDTRVPADDMHDVSFDAVVGEKPVALLFATPALCESRVCGPVVDIAAQLKAEYGDRMEFIHQEVFVDNQIDKGLRPPLEAFNLRTEPWLFTVDADGRVAARLEGSFGNGEFERAIKAAL